MKNSKKTLLNLCGVALGAGLFMVSMNSYAETKESATSKATEVQKDLNVQAADKSKADVKSIRHLLKQGANVNIKTKDGFTPLCIAANKGDKEIVKLLLANGADVNTKDKYTPLHRSAYKGHKEIVKLLIRRSARW